jgi:hypothetical protein
VSAGAARQVRIEGIVSDEVTRALERLTAESPRAQVEIRLEDGSRLLRAVASHVAVLGSERTKAGVMIEVILILSPPAPCPARSPERGMAAFEEGLPEIAKRQRVGRRR